MDSQTTTPGGGTRSATQELREQSEHLREDLRKLGRAAVDVVGEKLGETREKAGEAYDKTVKKAGAIEEQVVRYVRDEPIKAVLIAAGVGVVLGFLWSRR